jgi:transposase InsO family protein
MQRLDRLDRPTGRLIRRYERERPGELVHVDVKKLGRIPPGGGHRVHGWQAGRPKLRLGYDYIHSMVDDHSRLAYSEVLPDERGSTCAAFVLRAGEFFAAHGIPRIERVMTDNALAYRSSREFSAALAVLGAKQRLVRPFRPQTNGKVERFNRILLDEWAYVRAYDGNEERVALLPHWLHSYNFHRAHMSLGGQPPISRVNDLGGNYT